MTPLLMLFGFPVLIALGIFGLALRFPEESSRRSPFPRLDFSRAGRFQLVVETIAAGLLAALLMAFGLVLLLVLNKAGAASYFYAAVILFSITMMMKRRGLVKKPWQALPVSVPLALGWVLYPNWLTLDITAVTLAVLLLSKLGNIRLRYIVGIFSALMLYDVSAVFWVGLMQEAMAASPGAGGAATQAKAVLLPILIRIPSALSWNASDLAAVGLGDFVIPGLLVMRSQEYALQFWSTGGFVGGLIGALVALAVLQQPMPALLFLVPSTLGAFLLGLKWQKRSLRDLDW